MGSPTTGSKPSLHETMKCGYVCTLCRDSHPKHQGLVDRICHVTRCRHDPESLFCHAYMCRNCTRYSDDLSSFKREICSRELVVDGEAPERPWPLDVPPPLPKTAPSKPEASKPEASQPEASQPEASKPEASQPEASKPEASKPEASKPEAPSACPEPAKPIPSSKRPRPSQSLARTKPIQSNEDEELAIALSLAQEDLEQLLLLKDLQAEEERLRGLLMQKHAVAEPSDAYLQCISSALPHACVRMWSFQHTHTVNEALM